MLHLDRHKHLISSRR